MVESGDVRKFVWTNLGHQYFAVITVNIFNFMVGTIHAWITPVLSLLMSDDTPLSSGPLTNEQVSWLGSSGSLGAIIGNFVFSAMGAFCGCKQATTWITLPCVVFWLFVYFGTTYDYLFVGRVLGGAVGGGLSSTLPIYTSEISNDEIRGRLGSISMLSRNVGMLICFIIGSTLDYHYTPCVFVLIPIVSSIIFVTLPNTPQYYLQRNQLKEAENALKYYKGFEGKSLQESRALTTEFQRLQGVNEQRRLEEKLQFKDLCDWSAMKGIIIGIIIAILIIVSGSFSLLSYSILIFERSGAHLNSYLSSVMLFIAQILGCLCSTGLADKLGRKMLISISLGGAAIALSTLSLYLYLTEIGVNTQSYIWIPVVSLSFAIFIASAGIVPLGPLCTIELLPAKVRSFGLCVSVFVLSIASFYSSKTFPIWMEDYGLSATLFIYAIACFVGTLFVMFAVRETKGQSMDDVK